MSRRGGKGKGRRRAVKRTVTGTEKCSPMRTLMHGTTGIVVFAGILGFSVASADDLNVNPGLWEFHSVMKTEGPVDMPEERTSETECLTQDMIDEGPMFGVDEMEDGCEIINSDISSNEVNYTMRCDAGDGQTFETDYHMRLMGDRIEGNMAGDIETPMGDVHLQVEFEGERVADSC